MIPVGDSLRSRTTPYVNWALIILNIAVFIYELTLHGQPVPRQLAVLGFRNELDVWTTQWGVVPCRITDACPTHPPVLDSGAGWEWVTLITSQFIHGGWLHLLGNMLFLWVFGDNIEDACGHLRYLVFYLLCGTIAGLAQVASDPTGVVPAVGASGAIAGVLGAYLVTYPRASVSVVIPIIFIPWLTQVPAVVMMLLWFVVQIIGLGSVTDAMGGEGGVAYWAHIGGFVAGMLLIWFFRGRGRSYEPVRYHPLRWGGR